jgi:hypothetical protein
MSTGGSGVNGSGGSASSGSNSPQAYSGGLYTDTSTGSIDTGQPLPAMPAPAVGPGGSGTTSVDTSSLKTFADNLDTISAALGHARTKLNGLQPIRPGGSEFVEAQALKSKVSGDHGDGGLQQSFVTSLHALRTALEDTAEGIRTLAGKYSTIEEINAKAGTELHQLIDTANTDVQAIGLAGPSQPSSPPPPPGGQG